MSLVNVSRVINSKRLSTTFVIYRKTGSYINGRYVQTETQIQRRGVVTAEESKDIVSATYGDRVSGIMCFYNKQILYVTNSSIEQHGTSDEIFWNNNRYRLFKVKYWKEFGYYKAWGKALEGI